MRPHRLAVALLAATTAAAQTFQPPVPIGIGGKTVINPTAPIPIPGADRKWVRVRSKHFNIVSTASERSARAAAEKLELLTAALGRVNTKFASKPDNTRVFLFASVRDSQPYINFLLSKARTSTPGMFVANYDGTGTMIVDNGRPWADRTIFHELIHNLIASSGSRMPLWLEEGLAEYFSSAEIRGTFISVGQPVVQHRRWLRGRPLVSLKMIFSIERGSETAQHPFFYAQSWGVVDWMMRAGVRRFDRFIGELESGASAEDALQHVYGINSTVLERLLKRAPSRPAATIRMTVEADRTVTSTTIGRGEALHELGDFLGQLEPARADAERHFLAALADDPAFGRAHAGLGMLCARAKNYDEADPHFEKALALSPKDPEVYLEYGEALLRYAVGSFAGVIETGAGDAPRFSKARELAQRASELGGDRGRALAIVGISYSVEKDVAPGVAALKEALEAHPLRIDVALMLYALHLRTGNRKSADELYADYFARPRHPQARLAARLVFARERIAAANRLLADGLMDEATAVVRELVEFTPDASAREELQREIGRLQATAAINRQIITYNEAVRLANRGENQSALRILDDLLKKASDEKVVQDATALRAKLEKRVGMRRSGGAL